MTDQLNWTELKPASLYFVMAAVRNWVSRVDPPPRIYGIWGKGSNGGPHALSKYLKVLNQANNLFTKQGFIFLL